MVVFATPERFDTSSIARYDMIYAIYSARPLLGQGPLSGGIVIGVAAGILTYFAVHNLALSVLAGGPACAGAIKFLDAVIA